MLNTQLELNMTGPQVKELQQFLISKGYTVTSTGQTTEFFGPLTLAAVMAYQEDMGIAKQGDPGYGRVGPITLGSISTAQGLPPPTDKPDGSTPIISANKDKTSYVTDPASAAGSIISSDPSYSGSDRVVQNHLATNILGGPSSVGTLSKTIPLLGTPEYDKYLEGIEEAAYDIAKLQGTANNAQETAYANDQWNKLKDAYEQDLGFALGNSAMAAANQLTSLRQNMASRNISGSGIENQSIQDYLKQVQTQNAQQRAVTQRNLDSAEAQHYVTAGTPDDIQKLIDEDKAKGLPQSEWRVTKWGMIPDADIADALSVETLREKYPKMTDQEIADARSTVFDKNGNYLSSSIQALSAKNLELSLGKKQAQKADALTASDVEKQKAEQGGSPTSATGGIGGTSNAFSSDTGTAKATTPTTTTPAATTTPQLPSSMQGLTGQALINAIAKQNADYYTANTAQKPAGYTPYVAPKTATPPATTGLTGASTAAANISSNLSGAPKTGSTTPPASTTGTTSATITPPASTAAPKSSIMPTSIIDYMKAQNMDSSYANRTKLAAQYNIKNYTGSGDQNVALLGKIYKPPIQ